MTKRLIEEWLPIAEIGIESVRERTPMTPPSRHQIVCIFGGRGGRWWLRGQRCWPRCCQLMLIEGCLNTC